VADRVGLIGGTGVYLLPGGEALTVETAWGDVEVTYHRLHGRELFFTARHGAGHHLPPHKLNPKATVDALYRCGVRDVVALNAVGALRHEVATPSFLLPHDFIDHSGRNATYYDRGGVHVDLTHPYCPRLREGLAATSGPTPLAREGVYACTAGPRLETAAEVRMLAERAHVVGMTGYPEVVLARERGLCYASLCLVVNPGTGLAEAVSMEAIRHHLAHLRDEALDRVFHALKAGFPQGPCRCRAWLKDAKL